MDEQNGSNTFYALVTIGACVLLLTQTWMQADQVDRLEERLGEAIDEVQRLEDQLESYREGVRDGQIR